MLVIKCAWHVVPHLVIATPPHSLLFLFFQTTRTAAYHDDGPVIITTFCGYGDVFVFLLNRLWFEMNPSETDFCNLD